MTTSTDKTADTARVWKRAAYGGLVVAGVILVFGQTSVLTAGVAGVLAFAAGGYLGSRMSGAVRQAETRFDAAQNAPVPMAEPVAASAVADTAPVTTEVEATEELKLVQPSKVLPGQIELSTRKGTWRYEGNGASV